MRDFKMPSIVTDNVNMEKMEAQLKDKFTDRLAKARVKMGETPQEALAWAATPEGTAKIKAMWSVYMDGGLDMLTIVAREFERLMKEEIEKN